MFSTTNHDIWCGKWSTFGAMRVQDLSQSVGLGQALHNCIEKAGVAKVGQSSSLLNIHSLFGIEGSHTIKKTSILVLNCN